MKKQKIFLALIVALITTGLFAQTEKRRSVSVSYHPVTMVMLKKEIHDMRLFARQIKEYEAVFGDYGYKAVGYDERRYGAWQVEYKQYVSDLFRLNLGISCEFSSMRWDLYDVADGPRIKRIMDYRIGLLPGIDYLYFEKKRTKLYLSGQVGGEWHHQGMSYLDATQRNRFNMAWQLWMAININIPKFENLNMDIGFGYGTLGIMKLGFTYVF